MHRGVRAPWQPLKPLNVNGMRDSGTILVSGASGLVGSALCRTLQARGYAIRELSRAPTLPDGRCWDPARGQMDTTALDGVAAVVHLAGEPIAQRWTAARRRRIRDSRVQSTAMLVAELCRRDSPPPLILASGINYYGYACRARTDERSSSGAGFLAKVCREWEAATKPLSDAGGRVVQVRTGIVLSAQGGALAKLLPPFKLGLGGRLGTGQQFMSWICLSDLVAVYLRAIEDATLAGPINAVAPQALSNRAFTAALACALLRPALLPLPACMARLMFGAMADETLLADMQIAPQRLRAMGFELQTPTLEAALHACLQKDADDES